MASIAALLNEADGVGASSQLQNSETQNAPQIPQIRFVPYNSPHSRSLYFEAFSKEVKNGEILKVGRFTEKVTPSPNRIAFKSKVVSRAHADIWAENGQFYIKDTKSSSGTFLNQQRLSAPSTESPPTLLKDGDVLQLGVDYQGGVQDVFRCVRIRLEINRNWQHDHDNPFRKKALRTIEALKESLKEKGPIDGNQELDECCICLCTLAPFQALFVSPCCHTFHYKCIFRLLNEGPDFVCPLCRTYADLNADVYSEDQPETSLKSKESNPPTNSSTAPQNIETSGAQVPTEDSGTGSVNQGTYRALNLPIMGDIPTAGLENGFTNEIQDCRTPANPTSNLYFEGEDRANENASLNNQAGQGASPNPLLSPNVGEVRN